ncbi:MAG TPA: adenylate/guanylate cyclase domain-containing protein [Anaerolineales bacterium]|nr:adenylate/guanylate cyclase domain-containing protein [Anaerolineales bacterium]
MPNLRTTVILKTDIVDSTPRIAALTQSEMGLQRKQHKQFISAIAIKNLGSIFQDEGDAYWMEFPSVTTAALAAIEMHQNLRSAQAGRGEKQRLSIRAIITVGDVLHQEQDTIGTTLSLTARIEKITPPDEIYLSHAAWLVLNKAEIQTAFVGEFYLKGFTEPQSIYKVDQKHRTRVLTDQYIIFTDAKGFTPFVKSASIEQVENFLLECDDLINEICEKHGGVIRQVLGDQYFLTFIDANQTLMAIEQLCRSWKGIVERYKLGISIGIHKGNLNVIRSFVFGNDIHTTVYLSELDRFYQPGPDGICVVASGKIRDEFMGTGQEVKFRALDRERITQEVYKMIIREHGGFEFVLEDVPRI